MARAKSLTAQLLQAYQDAKKAKAAEEKRLQQEEARQARAAEQKRLRKEREAAKQERGQAQRSVAAQQEKKRQDAERARKVERVERDLARRQAARGVGGSIPGHRGRGGCVRGEWRAPVAWHQVSPTSRGDLARRGRVIRKASVPRPCGQR